MRTAHTSLPPAIIVDENAAKCYLHSVFLQAAFDEQLPLPERSFGLEYLRNVFLSRTRRDQATFSPWHYLDDAVALLEQEYAEKNLAGTVALADSILFEWSFSPGRAATRAATVFRGILSGVYAVAHAHRSYKLGDQSAYAQLAEHTESFLEIGIRAAKTLQKQLPVREEQGIVIALPGDGFWVRPN